jgi:hypothetical protein
MSNECPLDQGRTFQPQLPTIALPARENRCMQASASPHYHPTDMGTDPHFLKSVRSGLAVNCTPIAARPT